MTIEEAQIEKEQIETQIQDLINNYIKRYNLQFGRIDVTEWKQSERTVSVDIKVDFKI